MILLVTLKVPLRRRLVPEQLPLDACRLPKRLPVIGSAGCELVQLCLELQRLWRQLGALHVPEAHRARLRVRVQLLQLGEVFVENLGLLGIHLGLVRLHVLLPIVFVRGHLEQVHVAKVLVFQQSHAHVVICILGPQLLPQVVQRFSDGGEVLKIGVRFFAVLRVVELLAQAGQQRAHRRPRHLLRRARAERAGGGGVAPLVFVALHLDVQGLHGGRHGLVQVLVAGSHRL
mmetsp:Transcript_18507/g.35240  ORF Transcript_18507/g.35240 Transcript_18507/m.35240 type:complete len:231 (+) Transcript_18507:1019-1711(+)